jgi:hypothetical protein
MRLKTAYSMIVLGSISALNWISYARAFEIEEIPTIGFQSAIASLAPFSAFLALAAIYSYFHEKSGNKISFEVAVFHVSLASTPIAVNGMALLTWVYFTRDWTKYILSPLSTLLGVSVTVYEAIGPGVVVPKGAPKGEYLRILMWLLINYGAAWLAFFMLYAYLARVGKMRARMVFVALVFLYIITLAGHYLVVEGLPI